MVCAGRTNIIGLLFMGIGFVWTLSLTNKLHIFKILNMRFSELDCQYNVNCMWISVIWRHYLIIGLVLCQPCDRRLINLILNWMFWRNFFLKLLLNSRVIKKKKNRDILNAGSFVASVLTTIFGLAGDDQLNISKLIQIHWRVKQVLLVFLLAKH